MKLAYFYLTFAYQRHLQGFKGKLSNDLLNVRTLPDMVHCISYTDVSVDYHAVGTLEE